MGAPLKVWMLNSGKTREDRPLRALLLIRRETIRLAIARNQSYKIFVDVPNYPMDSIRLVTLTSGNPTSNTNNYFIDSVYIYVDTIGEPLR